jgi:predicted nuclease of restriction endonuclease-like RecB superfamily
MHYEVQAKQRPTIEFDRGTLVLSHFERSMALELPHTVWDPRVMAWRSPALLYGRIKSMLRQANVDFDDQSQATTDPVGQWKSIGLRDYQVAAVVAWELAGRRGIVAMATAAFREARNTLSLTKGKIQLLSRLLAVHRRDRLLIFTGDTQGALQIARIFMVTPIVSCIGKRERSDILARFSAGEIRTIVSCQVLNEGFDIPSAEVAIIVSGSQGEREFIQRVGRILRPAPDKQATIYELVSSGTTEIQKSDKRRSIALIQRGLLQSNTAKFGNRLVPRWFDDRDYHWIHFFLDECRRFAGRPAHQFYKRLAQPFPFDCPAFKLRLAAKVVEKQYFGLTGKIPEIDAVKLRRHVFNTAAKLDLPDPSGGPKDLRGWPEAVRREVSKSFPYQPTEVSALLFSDMPTEKLIAEIQEDLPVSELALLINFELIKLLFRNAQSIEVSVYGQSRAFVRQAKLTGLICDVELEKIGNANFCRIRISGPLAIVKRTRLYGTALGNLLPFLGRCSKFYARALIATESGDSELHLRSGDPFLPNIPRTEFDSKIERQFAKDFLKKAADWDLVREPRPIVCGKALLFPDFSLIHRLTGKEFLLEIVGFWTKAYLEKKLKMLQMASVKNLIICINKNLNCCDSPFPGSPHVLPYTRRIDVSAVIRIIAGHTDLAP